MLLIAGSPSLRRAVLDQLAASGSPAYADALSDLRPDAPAAEQPAPGDPRGGRVARRAPVLGRRVPRRRRRRSSPSGGACSTTLAGPLAAAHAEIAPDEAAAGRLTLRYVTNAPPLPGESPRDALARRLAETAEKEVWNGSTLVGPHRDDLVFELDGRDLADVRLARPAADGDPGPQARRARPPDAARRPPAAPPARRRLQRARPGAPLAPRPADRGAARRPSSPPRPSTTSTPSCARSRPPGRSRRARTARDSSAPTRRQADERPGYMSPPAPRGRWSGSATSSRTRRGRSGSRTSCGCRARSPPSRRSSRSACPAAAGACRVDPARGVHARRRSRRADRRAGAAPPRRRAADRLRGRSGRRRGARIAGPRPPRGSPRIIPRHLPATSEAPTAA